MRIRFPCLPRIRFPRRRLRRSRAEQGTPARPVPGILQVPRGVALALIAALVAVASLVSFAESYRGLYLWAHRHGLAGLWAAIWPLQVDVFIAVGELALFVALVDRWAPRSRTAAWLVTLTGLAVSVAGNVGHVTGHSPAVRATAAVPPLAAAAALAVGLGVLKRVVESHHERAGAVPAGVPAVPAVPEPGYGLNGHGTEAERVFAAEIEAGDIPSIRRIRAALHCGQPRAREVQAYLETLTPAGRGIRRIRDRYARAPKPAASTRTTPGTRPRTAERKLPGPALNRQEEPPGRGHRLAPRRRPVISHRIRRRRSRADRRLIGSALAVGVGMAVLSGHGAVATPSGRVPGKAADRPLPTPSADRPALPVGRCRAGRLRLLGAGPDGLPGGRDHHPPDVAGAVVPGPQVPAPRRRGTWCSSPGRTALRPPPVTWGS